MKLTDEQVADEAHMIRMEPGWPLWPILPVKNIHRGDADFEGPDQGIMVAGRLEPCLVYGINMLKLKPGPLDEQLVGVQMLEFPTIEDAVRTGWIGD